MLFSKAFPGPGRNPKVNTVVDFGNTIEIGEVQIFYLIYNYTLLF